MTALSRKHASVEVSPSSKTSPVRPATEWDEATPSPALTLKQSLEDRWVADDRLADDRLADDRAAYSEPRWSARRTVAFIGLTCGGFWAIVLFGIARLVH